MYHVAGVLAVAAVEAPRQGGGGGTSDTGGTDKVRGSLSSKLLKTSLPD